MLGGAATTGNLGVSALGAAAVKGILRGLPDARILFQNWSRDHTVKMQLGDRRLVLPSTRLHEGRRLRATSGTRHLGLLATLHRLLPRPFAGVACAANPTFAALAKVDVAVDLSAGDSFSDIYGPRAFAYQSAVKLLLLRMGKPLVLMPQTYGPFSAPGSLELVRKILDSCVLIASREIGGLDELQKLFGGWLPERAVVCPDIAFDLDAVRVDAAREPSVLGQQDERPLIGLNVSGLLYLSERKFGLRDSYARLIRATAEWVLQHPGRRLLLVPHVIPTKPPAQVHKRVDRKGDVTDTAACRLVQEELEPRFGDRIHCLGWPYTEGETKYLIGSCDFMIGARMHACVASISQGIPTVTLAYSKKAQGVMGHLGRWAPVVDLREHTVDECIEFIDRWYEMRSEVRAALAPIVARVRTEVGRFFTECLPSAILDSATLGSPGTS